MGNENFTILLVDDEEDILEFLSYNLKKENYNVFTSTNGKDAILQAKKHTPQLIILDVMMPEMDGIETCNEIKQISSLKNTFVMFLTARGEDYSQIAGFDAGADDYVTKPIKPKVFISRVKALLRRFNDNEHITETRYSVSSLTIDREKYLIEIDGKSITLPKKEFELLNLLTSKPNKVFTRDEIFEKVWGNDVIVGDRTIDVHVRKLREKLAIDNIKTLKGVGYKFEE